MKRVWKWLRTIYLAPFLFLMAAEGDASDADKEAEAQKEANDKAIQDAIARGDILVEEKDEIDPDILAALAAEADKDDDGKEKFIPRERFNEVNDRAKAVAEENERLKKELEEAKGHKEPTPEEKAEAERIAAEEELKNPKTVKGMEAKIELLQEQADELLVEHGPKDNDALKEVRKEINRLTKEIAKAEIREESETKQTAAEAKKELSEIAADSFSLYPFLDVNSDQCDEDAVLAVRSLRYRYEQEGMKPADALKKAVEEKGPKFAKALGFSVNKEKQAEIQAKRRQEALKRGAEASGKQPADLPPKGEDDKGKTNLKAGDLSQKQYDNLPESEKAKLRGDVL